jgi:Calcineurin-like phosphoesterase/Purple acid Phosphatase, N-terminal domain
MSLKLGRLGNVLLAPLAIVLLSTAQPGIADVPDAAHAPNSWLNITPGSDASQLCFSWATSTSHTPAVQIVKTSGGDTATFSGVDSLAYYDTTTGKLSAGWYQNKVTATGLALSTNYTYRVGYGTTWSDFHTIQTRDTSSFSFIAVGDPQIGASTGGIASQDSNVLRYDTAGWQNAMTVATQTVSNASFILSLGDQIDNTTSRAGVELQYDGYFSPPQLLGLPVATIEGNHDYGLGHYYGYHYNLPNQSAQNGATAFGNDGDYWFAYGQALFMVINSNTQSATTHDVFIGQAITANPNAKWKIVSFHHSLYSEADHALDADIVFRRSAYPPVFDKYGIDVVMSGHDHSYTRSYQMLGGLPVSKPGDSVMAVNPQGTLYMTFNSGSGSKYYQLNSTYVVNGQPAYPVYSKTYWQQNEPTFSRVKVHADTFSIVTYAINSNVTTAIDGYTIVKNSSASAMPTNKAARPGSLLAARLSGGSLFMEGLVGTARLEIFNASGAKVQDLGKKVFTGGAQKVALAGTLPSGLYVLRITGARSANMPLTWMQP